MKKMFLLFSHTLTQAQKEDAKRSLGAEEFVSLPEDLQKLWSNIPPHIESLQEYLEPVKEFLKQNAKEGDYALIQGDFGACCQMVGFVKSLGVKAVYATTTRNVRERVVNGKVEKFSVFEHVIFREY